MAPFGPHRVRFLAGLAAGVLTGLAVLAVLLALDDNNDDESDALAVLVAADDNDDETGDALAPTPAPAAACESTSTAEGVMSSRNGESESPIPDFPDLIVARCDWDLYLVKSDGSEIRRLTQHATPDSEPRWSPDGSMIAFVSQGPVEDDPTVNNSEIFVLTKDGSVINLSKNAYSDSEPAWSPDGQRIAFASTKDTDGYNSQIYVMNADGSNPVRLTFTHGNPWHDYGPAWSPDGKKIAFYRYLGGSDRGSEIFVMNADGTDEQRLTDNAEFDGRPAWSPDGRRIAFQSHRDGNSEIYVVNADGSSPTRLTHEGWPDTQPVWSPDGQRIAFLSRRAFSTDIFIMNADGTGQTNITNSPAGSPSFCCPDWRPTLEGAKMNGLVPD
jgi:Tol biopolymer transport system component